MRQHNIKLLQRPLAALLAWSLLCTASTQLSGALATAKPPRNAVVRLNRVGVHPLAPKEAWVWSVSDPDGFRLSPKLVDPDELQKLLFWMPVVAGRPKIVKEPKIDKQGQVLFDHYVLDYTAIQRPGTYSLRFTRLEPYPALEKAFRISEFVYFDLMKASFRALIYHRSGGALKDRRTGLLLAEAFTAPIPPSAAMRARNAEAQPLSLVGGWYQGPTYTRSVADHASIVAQLLTLYTQAPALLNPLKLDYPLLSTQATALGLPDILKEAAYGTQWLLTAQLTNGWLIDAVTTEDTAQAPVRPSEDGRLYAYTPPTVESSLLGAGTLAQAARVYRDKDMGFSVKALLGAEEAWRAAASQTMLTEAELQAKGWAALQLYQTTGKPAYLTVLEQILNQVAVDSWLALVEDNPLGGVMLNSLLTDDWSGLETAESLWTVRNTLANRVVNQAQQMAVLMNRHPYRLPLRADTVALSTPNLLSSMELLLLAYQLTEAPVYRQAAARLLDYVLGFNPWNTVFLTAPIAEAPLANVGIQHPCHALQQATKTPLPGMPILGPDTRYKTTIPFQDNAYRCETTAAPLTLNARFARIVGQLNNAFANETLAQQTAGQSKTSRGQDLPALE